jgi:hypothetical protein
LFRIYFLSLTFSSSTATAITAGTGTVIATDVIVDNKPTSTSSVTETVLVVAIVLVDTAVVVTV